MKQILLGLFFSIITTYCLGQNDDTICRYNINYRIKTQINDGLIKKKIEYNLNSEIVKYTEYKYFNSKKDSVLLSDSVVWETFWLPNGFDEADYGTYETVLCFYNLSEKTKKSYFISRGDGFSEFEDSIKFFNDTLFYIPDIFEKIVCDSNTVFYYKMRFAKSIFDKHIYVVPNEKYIYKSTETHYSIQEPLMPDNEASYICIDGDTTIIFWLKMDITNITTAISEQYFVNNRMIHINNYKINGLNLEYPENTRIFNNLNSIDFIYK